MTRRPVTLRVGGQALADGVLMRAGDVWAVARLDGSIETGRMPHNKWSRVPMLRVLASLGPALWRGIRAMGRTGSGRELPRRVRFALPLFLTAPLVVNALVAKALDLPTVWGWQTGVQALLLVAAQLFALRVAMPSSMWRFHGAEHKAVTAYEHGVDLADVDAVLRCSRVHDRCGTNVVAVLVALCLLPLPVNGPVGFVLFLGVFALSVEIVSAASRRPDARLSQAVLAGGKLLQRWVTTSEPTAEEQEVGLRALRVCLGLHAADAAGRRLDAIETESLAA